MSVLNRIHDPATKDEQAPVHTLRSKGSLRERLRIGMTRFPAIAALSAIAFTVSLLFIFNVFGNDPTADLFAMLFMVDTLTDGVNVMSARAAHLLSACEFAMFVAVVAQLAQERYGAEQKASTKIQAISAVVAVAFSLTLSAVAVSTGHTAFAAVIRWGLAFSCAFASAWLLTDERNERTLFPKLVCTLLYTVFMVGVLLAGLFICILATDVLLFAGSLTDKAYQIAFLMCFPLLWPNLLCAQLPGCEDELRVARAYGPLVGYVILPLCLLLLTVLYGYLAKIVITRSMPSGEMNWFGSFALLVYACLWMGLRTMEWKPAHLFVRWGWILLVPAVSVQLLGVWIRLQAYGLTPLRYASLLCTGVGIASLLLAARQASPRHLYAIASVVALMASISPANVFDVPNYDQTRRLAHALEQAGLLENGLLAQDASKIEPTEDVAWQITSSWDYLRWASDGYYTSDLVKDLRARSEKAEFEQLFGFTHHKDGSRYDAEERSWVWYTFTSDESGTEVSGFSRAYDLDLASENSGWIEVKNGYELKVSWADGTSCTTNLQPLVDRLMADVPTDVPDNEDVDRTVPADSLRIELDDGRVLALRSVSIECESGKADSVSVKGLLLVP